MLVNILGMIRVNGRTDSFGVLVGLAFSGGTRVLSVVGKFVRESMSGDSIGVYDGGTSSSNHRPDAALSVEHGEFQRGTGGCVEFLDIGFFFGQITTKRCGPDLQSRREYIE